MEVSAIAVELALVGTTRFTAEPPGSRADSWPVGTVRVGPTEIEVSAEPLGSGLALSATLRNPSRSHVVVRRVGFRLRAFPRLVLETGYQSWSPIRRSSPGDVRPLRRLQPLFVRGCYHADPARAGRVVAGDQYLLWAEDFAGGNGGAACFLDAAEHLSTIEVSPGLSGRPATGGLSSGGGSSGGSGPGSRPGSGGSGPGVRPGTGALDPGEVWAWALLDRVVLEPGSERPLDPLWIARGDPGALYSELAIHWGARAGAADTLKRPSAAPPSRPGWCSWYQYFFRVAPGDIRHLLARPEAHRLGLVVIDDGYQSQVGDWLEANHRWSSPGGAPADLAREIAGSGIRPGIWTAPFFVGKRSRVARDHPEWVVRSPRGAHPQPMMYNPVSWHGWVYALDTTQPAVLEHLRTTFAGLAQQGFSYHKVDFCYGATVPGRRKGDGRVTRAQALRAGLQAVRDGAGSDAYLLGCGCPFGPAVGVVDAMRVSPDVGPWWSPTLLKWPAYPESAPAAVNAIRASVLRAPLHRRLFVNDPDCLLLRPVKTRLSPEQRRVLVDTVAGTGGFCVLSDDLALYGDDEWAMVDSVSSMGDALDGPLDIADPFSRTITVRSDAAELSIDWDAERSSLTRRSGQVATIEV